MDFKQFLTEQGSRLMQDPRVAKAMQDERVLKGMMKAMQMRGRVQQRVDDGIDQVAESLNLATKKDLRELKRGIKKMQRELDRTKAENAKLRAEADKT